MLLTGKQNQLTGTQNQQGSKQGLHSRVSILRSGGPVPGSPMKGSYHGEDPCASQDLPQAQRHAARRDISYGWSTELGQDSKHVQHQRVQGENFRDTPSRAGSASPLWRKSMPTVGVHQHQESVLMGGLLKMTRREALLAGLVRSRGPVHGECIV